MYLKISISRKNATILKENCLRQGFFIGELQSVKTGFDIVAQTNDIVVHVL